MKKSSEFPEDEDLGDVKGNQTYKNPADELFGKLGDTSDPSRERYKQEPRFSNSRGSEKGSPVDELFKQTKGINSDNFGPTNFEDMSDISGEEDDFKEKRSSLMAKVAIVLASSLLVRKLLKSDKGKNLLDKIGLSKLIGGDDNDSETPSGGNEGGASEGKQKTKLGILGLIIVIILSLAIFMFAAAYMNHYLDIWGSHDAGFSETIDNIGKIVNGEEPSPTPILKTKEEIKVLPFIAGSKENYVKVVEQDGRKVELPLKTTKERGYARVRYQYNAENGNLMSIQIVGEYVPDNKSDKDKEE